MPREFVLVFRRSACCLVALGLLAVAGCGSGRVTKRVAGEVTLDGKPLSGVVVEFTPVHSTTGVTRLAHGQTDAAGKFTLQTYDPGDGAVPGEHKVTITWIPPHEELPAGEMGIQAMEEARRNPKPPPVSPVHENYTRVDKTPLTVTVPTSGPVALNLKADGT